MWKGPSIGEDDFRGVSTPASIERSLRRYICNRLADEMGWDRLLEEEVIGGWIGKGGSTEAKGKGSPKCSDGFTESSVSAQIWGKGVKHF